MLATQKFLARLEAIASKHSEHSRHFLCLKPPAAAVGDMKVWIELLGIANATRLLTIDPLMDPDVWVDASSDWGIAIVVGCSWRYWKLVAGWKTDGRDIGWAESVALEFTIYHLIWAGYSHVRLLIHSDSQGAIGQYNKGRGANQPTNDCIRCSATAMLSACIDIQPEYVPSADNRADGPSRGRVLENGYKLPRAFPIPEALKLLLFDV